MEPAPLFDTAGRSDRRRPGWIFIALFLAFTLAFVAIIWPQVQGPMNEEADFAANSLLIQDAKHLALTVGNYSRVGFNHPGPAILYVLAAGEVLFHDQLHLVQAPFAGQLLAITCYAALWLAMLGVLLIRISGAVLDGLLALGAFCAISAAMDHDLFLGAWFPDLYYLPFAVFTAALARVCSGRGDSLLMFAVSCGVLWNGHVAFIPVTAVMLICGIAGMSVSAALDRRHAPTPLGFVRANWRRLVAACFVVTLFMVPFCIETVVHYPGPVASYRHYSSGGAHRNGVLESLRYMEQYWGGWLAPLLGLLAVAVTGGTAGGGAARRFPGVVTAGVAGTVAVLFYAVFGIDSFEYSYIALFYYAVPAILLACSVAVIARGAMARLPLSLANGCAIAGTLALLGFAWRTIDVPAVYAGQYNSQGTGMTPPALFEQIRALDPHMPALRIVVEEADHGLLWTKLVAALAYAKRQDIRLFCISDQWHVLYTQAAKCTPADLARARQYFVTVEPGAAAGEKRIVFKPYEPPRLSPGSLVSIGSLAARAMLGDGWSTVEGSFVWSIGDAAHLAVALPPGGGRLAIDLAAFLPGPKSTQTVAVFAAGQHVADWTFDTAANRGVRTIDVPAGVVGSTEIVLKISKPESPQAAGLSGDSRQLGVALYTVGMSGGT